MQLESVTVTKSEKLELIKAGIHFNGKYAKTCLIKCYAETGSNDSEAWMCYKSSPAWKKIIEDQLDETQKQGIIFLWIILYGHHNL